MELARCGGLDVSLDLIFGMPGETLDVWQADLDAACELEPDHVSTYGLTFEQGTTFWNRLEHGELAQLDEELERSMYDTAIDRLTGAGFRALRSVELRPPRQRCRHNEAYWSGDEY